MKIQKGFSCLLIGALIITLSFILQNLNYKTLSYDEAGQFFISKGLNHDSEPFAKEKGLNQVIVNNANYNLDPGGFSILLHYWVKVSNSSEWLKLLPFVFFIGFILCWIYLFYYWFNTLNIALLAGFIPLFSRSGYALLGFEIRAYSMEYLGTMLCVIAILNLKIKITNKSLFIWSCIFSFFITSRYSEVIVVFVASLFIIYFLYTSKASIKEKLVSLALYATPLFITILYIIFASQIHQNKNMIELDYVLYLSRDFKALLTISNLLFFFLLVGLIVLLVLKNKYSFIKKHETIIFFTLSVNLIFILLSILGAYPWMPFKKQCISFFVLVNLCMSALFIEIICPYIIRLGSFRYYLGAFILIFAVFLKRNSFYSNRETSEDFYKVLTSIDLMKYDKIFVESASSSPSIRYLFEFGALKNQKNLGYPKRFTFGKFIKHHIIKGGETHEEYFATQPKLNSYLNYDLVICNKLSKYGDNSKWILLKDTESFYVKK